MDFFEAQELRHKRTKWLVLLYVLSILFIILGIFGTLALILRLSLLAPESVPAENNMQYLLLFAVVAAVNVLIIGAGTLYKTSELQSGGQKIASLMGGTRIPSDTKDLGERRLLNVVEEMALASGVSVPPVYIMNDEPSINAFAAGFSPTDAVIGVNKGTIEQLNRDELQGVIAHEFSHILNGDMRLNIRLIGVLFGIQVLAMIGYFIIRAIGFGSHRSRRNSKNGGQYILIIFVVALAFLIFGSIGRLFANLIKASISRQREYLADASAIQFTRYPEGIGGALKMIGSSATGSKMKSPEKESLSHMFFANGLASHFGGFLSTHPPLVTRIQKIDPSFHGNFQEYRQLRDKQAAVRAKKTRPDSENKLDQIRSPLGQIFPKEIANKFPIDPLLLVSTIGNPGERNVRRSQDLVKHIPEVIKLASRNSYSARCVGFAILLSGDTELRERQFRLILKREGDRSLETTKNLATPTSSLHMALRLPVLEMIQSSLTTLSVNQYQNFRQTIEDLVQLDNQTSLFEFIVRHHLLMHLDRRFSVKPPPKIKFHKTPQLKPEIELMLSAFASASASGSILQGTKKPTQESIEESYGLAMQVAGLGDAQTNHARLQAWEVSQLEHAMIALHQSSPAVKKKFLQAAAVLITFDHEITVAEAEFFRAVAESLDCPVPVFAVGEIKPDQGP